MQTPKIYWAGATYKDFIFRFKKAWNKAFLAQQKCKIFLGKHIATPKIIMYIYTFILK